MNYSGTIYKSPFNRFWMCLRTLPCDRQGCCSSFNEFYRASVITQLDWIKTTAGYAVSVLHACGTQNCGAITEAIIFLVGIRHSPLTFGRYKYLHLLTSIHYCMNNHSGIANVNHGGRSGLFKASNHQLGSAMKSDNEQSELPTVTHQNGFSSTMTIGVPTFNSRLYIYLYQLVALETCLPKLFLVQIKKALICEH